MQESLAQHLASENSQCHIHSLFQPWLRKFLTLSGWKVSLCSIYSFILVLPSGTLQIIYFPFNTATLQVFEGSFSVVSKCSLNYFFTKCDFQTHHHSYPHLHTSVLCSLLQIWQPEWHIVFQMWSNQLLSPYASINKVEDRLSFLLMSSDCLLLLNLWSTTSPRSLSYDLLYSWLFEPNDRTLYLSPIH